ncbi:transposase, partial [bacterium]|nr:transposase [bacterium]
MPTNQTVEAVVGSIYPASMRHLQQLIMEAEGCAKSYGKKPQPGYAERIFQEHGETLKDKVIGVCCDMWQPYIDMIEERLPKATLIFDKFHIVQHLNKAVDEVRREEARELKKENPELLQKTRYIWLKNPKNLTDKQRARLGHLEKLYLWTNRAYLLKEGFCEFWTYWFKGWAKKFLNQWFWWATHSRLKPMRDFAWMLRRHQEGLLNYFELQIVNGTVEGMNNTRAQILVRSR